MKQNINFEFLDFMTECGALLFGDFTLKSGRKSPYFINTGEYKTGLQLSKLGDFYANLILNSLLNKKLNFNVLYGPAYKGIPLAAITAAKLASFGIDLNVSFNRKERKGHGEDKLIMGYVPKNGDRIAIIEDVTTAGTSIRETISLLEELKIDAKIVALYISVDRMERGTENSPLQGVSSGRGGLTAIGQLKQEYGIDVYILATAADIITYLENTPKIENAKTHAENMRKYLNAYGVINAEC